MGTYFEKYGHTLITLAAIVAAFVGLVTIVGNRFDAQDRFNNLLFELVNQRLDAQDQHLDAQDRLANQRFEAVNQRLDAQDQRLDAQDRLANQRFEAVNQQFEAVNRQFEAVNQRLDRLTDEVSELRRVVVGIGERVSRNEGEIDVIREQLRIADTPSP